MTINRKFLNTQFMFNDGKQVITACFDYNVRTDVLEEREYCDMAHHLLLEAGGIVHLRFADCAFSSMVHVFLVPQEEPPPN